MHVFDGKKLNFIFFHVPIFGYCRREYHFGGDTENRSIRLEWARGVGDVLCLMTNSRQSWQTTTKKKCVNCSSTSFVDWGLDSELDSGHRLLFWNPSLDWGSTLDLCVILAQREKRPRQTRYIGNHGNLPQIHVLTQGRIYLSIFAAV